jgi:membrane-associated phospholipid phosphatase
MPLLVLLILALTVGLAVGMVVWRLPRSVAPSQPVLESARKVGETIGRHRSLRRVLQARLDPAAATGLALTLALLVAIGGGVLFALLAYLVRSNVHLHGVDNGVAKWGNAHASTFSTRGLDLVTQMGGIYLVVALCIVLALSETIVERSAWVIPFVIAVVGGEEILSNSVKELADRVRPAFNPAAASLGPSFPSGHSATAAAFYACAALLIGRRRARPTRAALAGVAAGLAVAVAASRVLLDVHWLTDVIAGLALGWAWFSVCAIAFGGRLLRFGASAETAARAADATARGTPRPERSSGRIATPLAAKSRLRARLRASDRRTDHREESIH